jgi:DNA-binding MarR family transcriptional regulator
MSAPSVSQLIASASGFLVLRLGDLARERMDAALREWQLTGRELRVLGHAHGTALSQRDLGELTGMDRTTMVAVVDKLERLGYARRERSVTDRRKQLIALTPAGHAALDQALGRLAALEADFLAPLAADEQRRLNDLLMRLYQAHDPFCERPYEPS